VQANGARVGEFGWRYGAEGEGPSLYIEDPEGNTVELKGPPEPRPAGIGDESVSKVDDLDAALKRHKPGDRVMIAFVRRGHPESVETTLQEDGDLEVVPVEATGGAPTDAQKAFRAAWIGQ